MDELELTRTREDRRLYELPGVGTLRLAGWGSRAATAEAGGRSWQLAARGIFRRVVTATDWAGGTVGEFTPGSIRRGGTLRWAGRELAVRPASVWRERYALADGERELAVFDGRGWGRRPVKVTIEDAAAIDAGLLLFSAFVVRGLAEDAGSTAGGATAATSAATMG